MVAEIFPPRVHRLHYNRFVLRILPLSIYFLSALRTNAQVCDDLVTIALDSACATVVSPDQILEGSYNYDQYTVSLRTLAGVPVPNTLNQSHLGQTLIATATDTTTGNSCWSTLRVEDHLPPLVSCKNIDLICAQNNRTPAYLRDSLGIQAAFPTVQENCSAFTIQYADAWFDPDCDDNQNISAYLQRVWTATDQSGNQSSCLQTITLQRLHADQVLFPTDTTVSCNNALTDPSRTGAPYFQAFGRAWPLYPNVASCELSIAYTDQILPICPSSYKILRTWTLLDWCLPSSTVPPFNPAFHIQVIHVIDKTGPALICPEPSFANANPQECLADVNLPDIVFTDNCSGAATISASWQVNNITYDVKGALEDFPGNNHWNPDTLGVLGIAADLPVGAHFITYTATDACGNSGACSFKLTVTDQAPPVAACDEYTQVNLGMNGEALIPAATLDDGSYDNCGLRYFKARRVAQNACQGNDQFFDGLRFCCTDAGDTIQVILRVYDFPVDTGAVSLTYGIEHSNECLVNVLVKDKLRPVCVAPLDVTVSCESFDPTLWNYGIANAADNCCLDTVFQSGVNLTLFDTLCKRGTIVRTFRAVDCNGLTGQCTQRVIVQNNQFYAIRFPDDLLLKDCDTTGLYLPWPEIFGEACEQMSIAYSDYNFETSPQACVKIERTWKIINWCNYDPNLPLIQVPNPQPHPDLHSQINLPGPVMAPIGFNPAPTLVRINANDPGPTNFSVYWVADANGYEYKQIITVHDITPPKVRSCPLTFPLMICDPGGNDPQLWNKPYWAAPDYSESGNLCEATVDLAVTGEDACSKTDVKIRYLLFLDLDGNDSTESVVSSTNPPPPGMIRYNNDHTPDYLGGELREFDHRPVPPDEKYRFDIQIFNFGNTSARLRWKAPAFPGNFIPPQLPHGKHKIRWIITDGCGNENYCEYQFTVKDCQSPLIVCVNGFSANIQPDTEVHLYISDFLQYSSDNCTPSDDLTFSIIRSGQNLGIFPLNDDGGPIDSVSFTCDDLGTQPVQLWVRDESRNATYCETYVIVQDNLGACANYPISIAGALKTEAGAGVEDVQTTLSGSHPAVPPMSLFKWTDPQGQFLFSNALPVSSNGVITPFKDDNHLNGVTTFDLVLISKHILGQQPLVSPYKMIAADANKSNSITIYDVVELRKLILGLHPGLPDNTSWRFIARNFVFPNLNNPFQSPFPENKSVQDVQSSRLDEDFIGVKIGDVNGSAISTNAQADPEDRGTGNAFLDVEDRSVQAGETVEVRLQSAEALAALQMSLQYPGLELLNIQPGNHTGAEHFAVFPERQTLTVAWDQAGEARQPGFVLVFKTLTAGRLSDMLQLSNRITRTAAYRGTTSEHAGVALRFQSPEGPTVSGIGFELYQNVPNPAWESTRIEFNLPEAGSVHLSVSDERGSLLWEEKKAYPQGLNSIVLQRSALGAASGLSYYRVATDTDTAVRKIVWMGK